MTRLEGPFLLVDTADRISLQGIYNGFDILAERRGLASTLTLEEVARGISELEKSSGIRLAEMAFLACGIGPGGFTSLRIGLSFIKAMGQAMGKPVVGVNRLEAAAMGQALLSGPGAPPSGRYFVRLPAAQDLEYAALYKIEDDRIICEREPEALPPEKISGIGVPKGAVVVPARPESLYLGIPRVAALKASAGMTQTAESILPMYLRGATLGPKRSSPPTFAKGLRVR